MSETRKQLEQECMKYADRTLRSWLVETYTELGFGIEKIGEMVDTRDGEVSNMLHFYKVPIKGSGRHPIPKPSSERLHRDYYDREMNYREMAKKYGVSRQTIGNWLHRDGTANRTSGEGLSISCRKRALTSYRKS